jgi:hypothetical protein
MEKELTAFLDYFERNKHDETVLRCVYVHGPPGCGKNTFVMSTLKNMDYDVVLYNAGDVRNKSIVDNINMCNMSSSNIMSIFLGGKPKKIAIVMDEIDCMNNGDKGGINTLIKLVRPKKTKKQKMEDVTHIPIVCIGNTHVDKKVTELMKCCLVLELARPDCAKVGGILNELLPDLPETHASLIAYAAGDLKKLVSMSEIVRRTRVNVVDQFEGKPTVDDSKQVVKKLLLERHSIRDHARLNETDRTIISMLWHENVADILDKMPGAIPLYGDILSNLCFADYIDRTTFQKQIWQFNEMSSLVKTFYANHLLHKKLEKPRRIGEVRFTKVLTKYSTEYNNLVFIHRLCQEVGMDKRDMLSHIANLRKTMSADEIVAALDADDINAVDINRLFRYMNTCNAL